jgi:hypothetical protein
MIRSLLQNRKNMKRQQQVLAKLMMRCGHDMISASHLTCMHSPARNPLCCTHSLRQLIFKQGEGMWWKRAKKKENTKLRTKLARIKTKIKAARHHNISITQGARPTRILTARPATVFVH